MVCDPLHDQLNECESARIGASVRLSAERNGLRLSVQLEGGGEET